MRCPNGDMAVSVSDGPLPIRNPLLMLCVCFIFICPGVPHKMRISVRAVSIYTRPGMYYKYYRSVLTRARQFIKSRIRRRCRRRRRRCRCTCACLPHSVSVCRAVPHQAPAVMPSGEVGIRAERAKRTCANDVVMRGWMLCSETGEKDGAGWGDDMMFVNSYNTVVGGQTTKKEAVRSTIRNVPAKKLGLDSSWLYGPNRPRT